MFSCICTSTALLIVIGNAAEPNATLDIINNERDNQLTNISHLRKRASELALGMQHNAADVNAASWIRGFEHAKFNGLHNKSEVQKAEEMSSRQAYEELLRNITLEFATAMQDRDNVLQTIDHEATRENTKNKTGDEKIPFQLLQKRASELAQVIQYDIADGKAASFVRGLEVAKYHALLSNISAAQEEEEMAARQAYAELLEEISKEFATAIKERDSVVQTLGTKFHNASDASPSSILANSEQSIVTVVQMV